MIYGANHRLGQLGETSLQGPFCYAAQSEVVSALRASRKTAPNPLRIRVATQRGEREGDPKGIIPHWAAGGIRSPAVPSMQKHCTEVRPEQFHEQFPSTHQHNKTEAIADLRNLLERDSCRDVDLHPCSAKPNHTLIRSAKHLVVRTYLSLHKCGIEKLI